MSEMVRKRGLHVRERIRPLADLFAVRVSRGSPLMENLPDANRPKRDAAITIDASTLLPSGTSYYSYDGSFTTPPCTEQVKWVILAQPISMSKQQIMRFREVIHGNNRPVQPLHGRQVFRSKGR